jgi:signal transduction histidine kinase
VQSLKNDNQRLLRILSELLDLTQVEAGRIQLNIQPVPPVEIIDKAESSVANVAKEKNIVIKRDLEQNPGNNLADQEKTVWVLNNFLTNAIRYSPENSEVIIRSSKKGNQVELGIHDHGIGINPNYQQKIFDRFFRVPGTTKKGSGLGLAISKELVESMGGQVGLHSEEGKGSYFYLRLPKA